MNALLNWLHLPVFCLLVYLLWRLGGGKQLRWVFCSALFFKLLCGLLLGWLYQEYLNIGSSWYAMGDTWTYHAEALKVVAAAKENLTWYGRFLLFSDTDQVSLVWEKYSNSFFFLKPMSLLYLLTGNSYWWSGAYLSLFSFAGCWFLSKSIKEYYPAYRWAVVLTFLFFPSTIFWTSGVLKDSVLMGSLCFTVGLCLQLVYLRSLKECLILLFWLLPAAYLLWKIKFFLAAVLFVLLGTFLVVVWLRRKIPWLRPAGRQVLLGLGILLAGALAVSSLHQNFTLDFLARHTLKNYRALSQMSSNAPKLEFPDLEPTMFSLVQHAPEAVIQMLVRPFAWEEGPFFYRLAGMENLLILVLVLLTVAYLLSRKKIPCLPSFLAVLLVFFLISAVLVTLPTPNLGSLHRYRAPLLPFFLTVVLAWGPIPSWFAWLQKRRG